MDIYTLDSAFKQSVPIDEYISVIWTERYTDLGDVTLSVEASLENRNRLAKGTMLATPDSDYAMMVLTHEVQDGVLKITGQTLDETFSKRLIWPSLNDYDIAQYLTASIPPGQAMWDIVQRYCASGGWFDTNLGRPFGIVTQGNVMLVLAMGATDVSGTSQVFTAKRGPVLDFLKETGQANNIGWKLIPNAATGKLDFSTYSGRRLTSDQSTYPFVQFSPELDSLTDVKELSSNADYCTVAHSISPGFDPLVEYPGGVQTIGRAYAYKNAQVDNANYRAILVEVTDINVDTVPDFTAYTEVMMNAARTALAQHNGTKVIDGQIVSQNQFIYGTDYFLGDIIELKDQFGYTQPARVTEYIRSKDGNGSKAYPTVAVID